MDDVKVLLERLNADPKLSPWNDVRKGLAERLKLAVDEIERMYRYKATDNMFVCDHHDED